MTSVEEVFEDRTFRWKQLERQGMAAIYEQEHKVSGHKYFEVVRLRVRPAHTWPDGRTTPEHEAYPGAAAWGADGWTHWTLDEAQTHLAELLANREEL